MAEIQKPYVYQEYPKLLTLPSGREVMAYDAAQESLLLGKEPAAAESPLLGKKPAAAELPEKPKSPKAG